MCRRERGLGGDKAGNEMCLSSVVSVKGQKGGIFSLFLMCLTFKNAAPLWDYHRYRRMMLALERKLNGHCASSLIDHYQQHGGGAHVETAICYCKGLQNTVCRLHSTGAALTVQIAVYQN